MEIELKNKQMIEQFIQQGAIIAPKLTFIVTKEGEKEEPPYKKMRVN